MIGGTDIQIRTQAGTEALEVALRLAKTLWPDSIVEDAVTGERCADVADFPLPHASELLVYRDSDAAKQWDEYGAVAKLRGTLIHLLLGEGNLTVTIDDPPPSPLKQYVRSLRSSLRKLPSAPAS